MKILTVLGARPQFIKAAAISRAIQAYNSKNPTHSVSEVILHTGQHYDPNMSDMFFVELDIPRPTYNLGIGGLSHGAMTGRMLEQVEEVITCEQPDWLLVYGDTNSTLAGALAAAKLRTPVAHVEAGLRSYNPEMPEEINRVLTDRVSTMLFCPTAEAMSNLAKEGFPYPVPGSAAQTLLNVGDVMYDVTRHFSIYARERYSLDTWGVTEKAYALCTLHRAENTDDAERLEAILKGLRYIAEQMPVLLPLHPRTRNILAERQMLSLLNGINLLEPVSYLEMQRLEMSAAAVLTDSGGVQKEAYFHAVPCITLREETEWVETIELGWNQLVGANSARIVSAFISLQVPTEQPSIYGDGAAATHIVAALAAGG